MKIAVDFDGTIVEARYPAIGEEKIFAFRTLQELQKKGHQLILWTSRSGEELEEAVEYCRKKGIEFYAVNRNYPEEAFDETMSRKIVADLYIDDRIVGGFQGWGEIYHMIHPEEDEYQEKYFRAYKGKRSFLQKIKNLFQRGI